MLTKQSECAGNKVDCCGWSDWQWTQVDDNRQQKHWTPTDSCHQAICSRRNLLVRNGHTTSFVLWRGICCTL